MTEKRSIWRRVLDDIILYILWAILIVAGLVIMLRVRALLNLGWILITFNRWSLRAIDRFGLLIMGLVWLAGIILAEASLRDAMEKGKMYARFARFAIILAIVAGVIELLLWVVPKVAA